MNEEKKTPEKLDFNVDVFGHSMPIWHYNFIPTGMRPAKLQDLYSGRAVLYKVQIGPDAGDYYTDYVRPTSRKSITSMVRTGWPVYVRDIKNNQ